MKENLEHKLKNRHIQMIALGGIIGTGFFLGSAQGIKYTGSSLVLVYLLGGFIMYCIMRILGEMTVYSPNSGSFVDYAYRFLGKAWGFIIGWNSWVIFTLSCMLEATAVAYLLDYWFIVPHWLTCLVVILLLTAINLLSVKHFAELEFWFAGIKIVFIIGIILVGIYLICFDQAIHSNMMANFKIYLVPTKNFHNGALGFIKALSISCFSLCGAEFVSVAAGEASNPKKSIPRAINGVFTKIVFFYIATIAIILLIYPYHHINYQVSPFIEVFARLGFKYSAIMINIVAITATLSALNSIIYVSSRFLYKLALNSQAPSFILKTSQYKSPVIATLVTAGITLLAVLANYLISKELLLYLYQIISIGILLNWVIIVITHFAFRQYIKNKQIALDYTAFAFPWLNWILLIILAIIMIVVMSDLHNIYSFFLPLVWVLLLYICHLITSYNVDSKTTLNN